MPQFKTITMESPSQKEITNFMDWFSTIFTKIYTLFQYERNDLMESFYKNVIIPCYEEDSWVFNEYRWRKDAVDYYDDYNNTRTYENCKDTFFYLMITNILGGEKYLNEIDYTTWDANVINKYYDIANNGRKLYLKRILSECASDNMFVLFFNNIVTEYLNSRDTYNANKRVLSHKDIKIYAKAKNFPVLHQVNEYYTVKRMGCSNSKVFAISARQEVWFDKYDNDEFKNESVDRRCIKIDDCEVEFWFRWRKDKQI